MTIYTIGHSTRGWDEFLQMLLHYGIRHLGDVRSFPGSRRFPHFNREALARNLEENALAYSHLKNLGGLRRPVLDDSPNLGWENPGFRAYADHMLTPQFQKGLEELCRLASRAKTAVLCAEAVPWRCHRQLLADALTALRGVRVVHILSLESTREHQLTPFARLQDGRLVYPPAQAGLFSE